MCCFRGQKVFIKFNGKLNAGLFNSYKYSIFLTAFVVNSGQRGQNALHVQELNDVVWF